MWQGEVAANQQQGTATGVNVNPGDKITIVANGWAGYGPSPNWGPQGDKDHPDQGLICHDAYCGALVMKIGSSAARPVNCGVFRWDVPEAGEVTFIYNDVPGTYGNNSGSFQVSLGKDEV